MPRRSALWLALALGALLVGACGPAQDPRTGEAAIRSAIFRHLGQRANLTPQNMVVTVNNLDTQGETAVANVTIAARENRDASMEVVYHLRRVDGRWEVDPESTPGIGAGHGQAPGAGGQMPSGHPPLNSGVESGGSSGDATGGSGSKLPEGHPPIPAK